MMRKIFFLFLLIGVLVEGAHAQRYKVIMKNDPIVCCASIFVEYADKTLTEMTNCSTTWGSNCRVAYFDLNQAPIRLAIAAHDIGPVIMVGSGIGGGLRREIQHIIIFHLH